MLSHPSLLPVESLFPPVNVHVSISTVYALESLCAGQAEPLAQTMTASLLLVLF